MFEKLISKFENNRNVYFKPECEELVITDTITLTIIKLAHYSYFVIEINIF